LNNTPIAFVNTVAVETTKYSVRSLFIRSWYLYPSSQSC